MRWISLGHSTANLKDDVGAPAAILAHISSGETHNCVVSRPEPMTHTITPQTYRWSGSLT